MLVQGSAEMAPVACRSEWEEEEEETKERMREMRSLRKKKTVQWCTFTVNTHVHIGMDAHIQNASANIKVTRPLRRKGYFPEFSLGTGGHSFCTV